VYPLSPSRPLWSCGGFAAPWRPSAGASEHAYFHGRQISAGCAPGAVMKYFKSRHCNRDVVLWCQVAPQHASGLFSRLSQFVRWSSRRHEGHPSQLRTAQSVLTPAFPATPMKKSLVSAVVAAVLMASAAAVATVMTPTRKLAEALPKLDLEIVIPDRFGDWTMDNRAVGGVVNPQQTELLNKLYSQILSRTYYNSQGYRIMLSIAYGENQREGTQLHEPEVCYPAQGFQLSSRKKGELNTSLGPIKVKRLETNLSQQRYEPVTYWTTVAEEVYVDSIEKKIAEIRYGLRGDIPDGLLFRVSSIDRNSSQAYSMQQDFVNKLLESLPPDIRVRIAGL